MRLGAFSDAMVHHLETIMDTICTVYIIDQYNDVYSLTMSTDDAEVMTIMDHIDWCLEHSLMGDELLNIVIH